DGNLFFKSYDKIYSVDVLNGVIMTLVENIDDATSEGSFDNLHFAYNESGEDYQKTITLVNMVDMSREYIRAKEKEKIQVITFMNDDLFYGVANVNNEWIENGKIIGHPFKRIIAINTVTKEQKVFQEEGYYYYNFVRKNNALHYNKYRKQNNHYIRETNDVIINNYVEEKENTIFLKEEMTKKKLRTAYLEIDTKKVDLIKEKQLEINVRNTENEMLEKEIKKQKDIYYVYNNGVLQTKTEVLSDGIGAIRDSFGYVKMNDKITCYNRSNKGNVSYLRKNDSIIQNLEKFKENICLIDDKILVMNLTGVKCRDLEYYISLGEKVACFKNDTFQFFVTGYDNNNYVLEYPNKDRVLTPRAEVETHIENEGYVTFGQLTSLE
ncbi:MAG: hypothetical protein MJ151_00545, partial [Lachnospiraceae bacterium]|nr:hypothetical protein [Lachnospiraceae bacterium]